MTHEPERPPPFSIFSLPENRMRELNPTRINAGFKVAGYTILDVIGTGGTSTVFRAQHSTAGHAVAIKVPNRVGLFDLVDHEIRTLRSIRHPGIAAMHDAGWFSHNGDEVPYIAMELINGFTLRDARHELTEPQRLAVFSKILDAVAAAHRCGIGHRDLKPTNVMLDRETLEPKVVDFGLSAATHVEESPGTQGRSGVYSAPEVHTRRSGGLRADVFSLGVIGFELFAVASVSRDARGRFCHSGTGTPLRANLLRIADPYVRRNLHRVLTSAVSAEPADRYPDARRMLSDVRATLRHELMERDRRSPFARLRHSARHRRTQLCALVVLAGLLAASSATAVYYANRTTIAELRAAYGREALDEYLRLIKLAGPSGSSGQRHDLSLAEALHETLVSSPSGDIGAEFDGARRLRYGEALIERGEYIEALAQLRRARTMLASTPPQQLDLGLLESERLQVSTLIELQMFHDATRVLGETLERHNSALGPLHPQTLKARHLEGQLASERANYDLAMASLDDLLRDATEVLGNEHPDVLEFMNSRAMTLQRSGDPDGAISIFEQLVEARESSLGPLDPFTVQAKNNLAVACEHTGDHTRADHLYQTAIADATATLGPSHTEVLEFRLNRCLFDLKQGRIDDALRRARECRDDAMGLVPTSPIVVKIESVLAVALTRAGQHTDALRLLESVEQIRRRTLGREHPLTVSAINNHAICLFRLKKTEQALALFEEALDISVSTLGPEHPETLISMGSLASAYAMSGRLEQARGRYADLLPISRKVHGPEHRMTHSFEHNYATILTKLDQDGIALEILRRHYELRCGELGPAHDLTLKSAKALARVLGKLDRSDEAATILTESHQACLRIHGSDDPRTAGLRELLPGDIAAMN
ncbi:MAG: serine/threonine-protein kinase [Phycisphaerales bacterium]